MKKTTEPKQAKTRDPQWKQLDADPKHKFIVQMNPPKPKKASKKQMETYWRWMKGESLTKEDIATIDLFGCERITPVFTAEEEAEMEAKRRARRIAQVTGPWLPIARRLAECAGWNGARYYTEDGKTATTISWRDFEEMMRTTDSGEFVPHPLDLHALYDLVRLGWEQYGQGKGGRETMERAAERAEDAFSEIRRTGKICKPWAWSAADESAHLNAKQYAMERLEGEIILNHITDEQRNTKPSKKKRRRYSQAQKDAVLAFRDWYVKNCGQQNFYGIKTPLHYMEWVDELRTNGSPMFKQAQSVSNLFHFPINHEDSDLLRNCYYSAKKQKPIRDERAG